MRISHDDTNEALSQVTIYLTKAEAVELQGALAAVLWDHPTAHTHVPDASYEREITVCTYNLDQLDHFDERSRRLLLSDLASSGFTSRLTDDLRCRVL
jgi:hypothetical protein